MATKNAIKEPTTAKYRCNSVKIKINEDFNISRFKKYDVFISRIG